ncbi:alkaline phosphatase D family protein [Halobium salinum]|uniref:Alkaline phosphatase D family protein n=1 Tax=Halobium salinum TaxID=1364940 RepID=A0ABD5PA79_9EURY|nr:alkaline phosphatase D family protein [Halobium salinum]
MDGARSSGEGTDDGDETHDGEESSDGNDTTDGDGPSGPNEPTGSTDERAVTGGNAPPSDSPAHAAPDHGDLLSALSGRDLAVAADPREADDPEAFETTVDADADPEAVDVVFPQSVASGGPTPEGVILWTRVAPEAYDSEDPLGVEVATDPDFEDVVYRGLVEDGEAVTAHDHTVKVDLDGALSPGTTYHYRFVHGDVASRTGRCRTLPDPDASPESVAFAVLTCQNYANGYFGAFDHVADEDVDFVVHVGDFIYEDSGAAFTGLGSPDLPDRHLPLPNGHDRVEGLDDYRFLHRTYRSDRHLQRMLERHTLLPAWDDHEIADDVYWDREAGVPRANHPESDDPAFMTNLVADALHAWWEYMPARVEYDPTADDLHERVQLWRTVSFGDLVDVAFSDERLFRDGPREDVFLPTERATAPENEPPGRTMLGERQLSWLLEAVEASTATWTVWCDEVLTMPFKVGAGPATFYPVQGGWDGYRRERTYISQRFAEWDVENLVTLTGDMHCYVAGYKQTRYPGPFRRLLGDGVSEDERIGVEFMTPPVTSLNWSEAVGLATGPFSGVAKRLLRWGATTMNPHIEYFDSHHWGYSVVEFTRDECTYTGYAVDKTTDEPYPERERLVEYRVPEGRVELERVD